MALSTIPFSGLSSDVNTDRGRNRRERKHHVNAKARQAPPRTKGKDQG